MKNFLLNGRILPNWIILLVDMLIVSWSFSFSYFIFQHFDLSNMNQGTYLFHTILVGLLALPVIYFFRLHTGLLRYSNTQDMLYIFASVFTFSVLSLIVELFIIQQFTGFYIPRFASLLIINFFITSSLLIMLRIAAKTLFYVLIRRYGQKEIKKVLIYGSDKNAVLIKQALENSDEAHYIIEGFIDTDRSRLNRYMEQKKVYHIKELTLLRGRKLIDELVIVNEQLGEHGKKIVIERSLRLGIKVITIPPADKWLLGKLDKKQMQKLRIEDLLQRKPIIINQTKVREDVCGKRILVTGAAGSIGSEIVRQLLSFQPALLVLCDQAESPLHEIQLQMEVEFPRASVEIVIGDVRNKERMHSLFQSFSPQMIFHAAAYKHVPLMENNPFEAIMSNVKGTKNIADLAVQFGAEKFVMISTDKAVNPTNIMGASKRIAEIYTQSLNEANFSNYLVNGYRNKTRFITTRFGNVLGSNGSVIPRFRGQIEKGGPITVTHPEITRYFMTIPEAVQLVLEAGTMGNGGEIFVFDMGDPVKIKDLAKKMIQLAGFEVGRDIDIVYTGLRPGEKLYEELLASTELTLPTHHEKINISKVRNHSYASANRLVSELLLMDSSHDNESIVRKMKEIVPEFISKNSPYEQLDVRVLEEQAVS